MSRTLIGTRIRERRRAKKKSQSGLAQEVGISASYLNLIEHNRRGIAGKTLLAIAKSLEINPRDLSEGADQGLIDKVKEAIAKNRHIPSEVERLEEFIGRFPGFARLIERLFDLGQQQDQNLQALSDKMNSDPFFAEAIHLMLSNITTIRSTADILQKNPHIEQKLHSKFLSNLLKESERLSQTASGILEHFEQTHSQQDKLADQTTLDTYLESNHYHLEILETGDASPTEIIEELEIETEEQKNALGVLQEYETMAQKFPLQKFLNKAEQLKYSPLELAAYYKTDLRSIFYRLAHLPEKSSLPNWGLLECDGSGAVLYRKQLTTLSLPRFGSACPLWPIYRSFSQPMQPICALLDMPTGERFLTYAVAQFNDLGSLGVPGTLKASMIITQDYDQLIAKTALTSLPQLSVGLQCSVCPKLECKARRATYILG